METKHLAIAALALYVVGLAHAAPFVRYPTASKTDVAFVAADQLRTAPLRGGKGHRIFEHWGIVTTPLSSPDGRWIAYPGRHSGVRNVFIKPARGGQPGRHTFEASNFADGATVVAWTPDSKHIVFLSQRASPVTKLVRAFSVPLNGGAIDQLPLDRAGSLTLAPEGREIAYNRLTSNLRGSTFLLGRAMRH